MHKLGQRPKNLNLLTVKFPMSAIMSVGHRASGILMFLSLPWLIYLFQLSLTNESGFELARQELSGPFGKILAVLLIWSLAHHFIAGIRYFLLDVDIGIDKKNAQRSALWVMIGGVVVALFGCYRLFIN